jgi:hypothetical protein
MARWRQAIELAMTGEDMEKLAAIARSRSEAARRVERARILLAYREKPSFFAVGQRLGLHHQTVQRCVGRALAYGPLTALDDRPRPGKDPTLHPRQKRGWYLWLATRPRITVIRTNCGRRGCWRAMRARTRRPPGTNVSPNWCRERCARYSAKRKSSRTRYGIIWNVATPSSSRRWRRFCAFIARSRS